MNPAKLLTPLIILTVATTLLLPAGHAATPITKCQDITQPGEYVLTKDIAGTQSGQDYCIGIKADNVVLDCQAYSINGKGTGEGIYANGRNKIAIGNCIITKYAYGIYFEKVTNSIITNNRINNNYMNGIIFWYSNNNKIMNNQVKNNLICGIDFWYSNNNQITNNQAEGALLGGISLRDSQNNIIKNNTNTTGTNVEPIEEPTKGTYLIKIIFFAAIAVLYIIFKIHQKNKKVKKLEKIRRKRL